MIKLKTLPLLDKTSTTIVEEGTINYIINIIIIYIIYLIRTLLKEIIFF